MRHGRMGRRQTMNKIATCWEEITFRPEDEAQMDAPSKIWLQKEIFRLRQRSEEFKRERSSKSEEQLKEEREQSWEKMKIEQEKWERHESLRRAGEAYRTPALDAKIR